MLCFSYLREVSQVDPLLRSFVVGVVRFVFIMAMYDSGCKQVRRQCGADAGAVTQGICGDT